MNSWRIDRGRRRRSHNLDGMESRRRVWRWAERSLMGRQALRRICQQWQRSLLGKTGRSRRSLGTSRKRSRKLQRKESRVSLSEYERI